MVNLGGMSPWRVALLSTLGMLTMAVVVYRLTPQRALPALPATPPVITTPAPLPAAPAPPPVPLAVATSSAARAELAAPELGRLVAVAVGGPYEFSVDGQSITTSATLRLQLPPGPHVVECGSRTRSVTVRNGETSMARFKL